MSVNLAPPAEAIAGFCRKYYIRRLALFGSILRDDFSPASDVDVLVEFERGRAPGFFGLARMEEELSPLFAGRKVDLRTPEDLSRYFREEVLDDAEVLYHNMMPWPDGQKISLMVAGPN